MNNKKAKLPQVGDQVYYKNTDRPTTLLQSVQTDKDIYNIVTTSGSWAGKLRGMSKRDNDFNHVQITKDEVTTDKIRIWYTGYDGFVKVFIHYRNTVVSANASAGSDKSNNAVGRLIATYRAIRYIARTTCDANLISDIYQAVKIRGFYYDKSKMLPYLLITAWHPNELTVINKALRDMLLDTAKCLVLVER